MLPKTGRIEEVADHLAGGAEMAAEFARPFGAESWAYAAGMAHDIGKYSTEFQNRILCDGHKVDHSTAGAALLDQLGLKLLAYCVAGHHAGLPDGGTTADVEDCPTLRGRLLRAQHGSIPDCAAYAREVELNVPKGPSVLPVSRDREDGAYSLSFFDAHGILLFGGCGLPLHREIHAGAKDAILFRSNPLSISWVA